MVFCRDKMVLNRVILGSAVLKEGQVIELASKSDSYEQEDGDDPDIHDNNPITYMTNDIDVSVLIKAIFLR